MDGNLATEVKESKAEAVRSRSSFEQFFFTKVGLLSVPFDFNEDLDNKL